MRHFASAQKALIEGHSNKRPFMKADYQGDFCRFFEEIKIV
jgi:hypothetical protein